MNSKSQKRYNYYTMRWSQAAGPTTTMHYGPKSIVHVTSSFLRVTSLTVNVCGIPVIRLAWRWIQYLSNSATLREQTILRKKVETSLNKIKIQGYKKNFKEWTSPWWTLLETVILQYILENWEYFEVKKLISRIMEIMYK